MIKNYDEILGLTDTALNYEREAQIFTTEFNNVNHYLNDKGYKVNVVSIANNVVHITWEPNDPHELQRYIDDYAYYIAEMLLTLIPKDVLTIDENTTWYDIKDAIVECGIDYDRIKIEMLQDLTVDEACAFFARNWKKMNGIDEIIQKISNECRTCIFENTMDYDVLESIKQQSKEK